MPEDKVAQRERNLKKRTADYINDYSDFCSICYGKLSDIFTCEATSKGAHKYFKSVYGKISREELDKILYFHEAPLGSKVEINLFFWDLNGKKPIDKHTLHYGYPGQLDNYEKSPSLAWVKRLVK